MAMMLSQVAISFIYNCCKTLQLKRVGYVGVFMPLSHDYWCNATLVTIETVLLRAIFVSPVGH